MVGEQIKQLLDSSKKYNKSQLAHELEITERTLDTWLDAQKKASKRIDEPYVEKIQRIFQTDLLQDPIKNIADKAFEIQKCELISIWLMRRTTRELILIRDTSRHENLVTSEQNISRSNFYNDEIHKPLNEKSITMYAVHFGGRINLADEDIRQHPWKKIPHRNCGYLSFGICESLLKLSLKIPEKFEPATRAVLSLENALFEKETQTAKWSVIKLKAGEKKIFQEEQARRLEEMFRQQYIDQLQPLLIMLDYQDEKYCASDFLPTLD